ncbi:MAG TPA: YraN family protein [Candidatus Binatia bacterium]|nr:YraN family protein [Candidatus Binatia bacterium]
MRTRQQRLGDAAEDLVAARLRAAGWQILGRQVRVGRDEIDLVALDPGPPPALVAVEVRWRARSDFGLPEETVDHRKRARLRRAVLRLLAAGRLPDGRRLPSLPIRLDVVVLGPSVSAGPAITVRHLRGIE